LNTKEDILKKFGNQRVVLSYSLCQWLFGYPHSSKHLLLLHLKNKNKKKCNENQWCGQTCCLGV